MLPIRRFRLIVRCFSLFLSVFLFLSADLRAARLRIIIDTDAACERDDQYAIAYALLSPEIFQIEGFTAVHNGPGTLDTNFLEIHNLIALTGTSGIPVYKGAAGPLPDPRTPLDSPAARFILERSKDTSGGPLMVLGIGAATDLASVLLLDPSVRERVTFTWLGGADWPAGRGGEHNIMQDLTAARVLFGSGARLEYIPCGNNVMFQTRYHSARNLRGVSPLGDYLHLLMLANPWPMEEPFNIADLAAVGALAHPEYAYRLKSPAPWLDDNGGYDWSRKFGEITVVTNLSENVYGAPVPLWDEFYRKVAGAAPPVEGTLEDELCHVLNIHPAPPDVAPVEGPVEKFQGFTRQELRWPTIGREEAAAFVCKPLDSGNRKLPAVICLSGTNGDRFLLSVEKFGISEYVGIGRDTPHQQLHGWAAELARRGYVTLSLTQRGLGERGLGSDEQSKAALLAGFTFQGFQAHEIRQALTYLSRRPEVDPGRIGCTGFSFGGITTFYSTAVDRRFKAAAPLCGGVGSLRRMIEVGETGYHGHYWWIPSILLHFDMGDIVAAQAPRPYFIAAPLQDIGMPKEGVDELLAKARPAYARAGAPDALVAYRPPGEHGFTMEMFEELVKFLDKYL